jgi:hypothetical protein
MVTDGGSGNDDDDDDEDGKNSNKNIMTEIVEEKLALRKLDMVRNYKTTTNNILHQLKSTRLFSSRRISFF